MWYEFNERSVYSYNIDIDFPIIYNVLKLKGNFISFED